MSNSFDALDLIAKNLQILQSDGSPGVPQAVQFLTNLKKENIFRFLKALIQIIGFHHAASEKTKTFACLVLQQDIQEVLKGQELETKERISLMEEVVTSIYQPQVHPKLKHLLQKRLEELLNAELELAYVAEFLKNNIEKIKQKLQEKNYEDYFPAYLVFQSMLKYLQIHSEAQIARGCFDLIKSPLVNSATTIINKITGSLETITTDDSDQLQIIIDDLCILQTFVQTITNLVSVLGTQKVFSSGLHLNTIFDCKPLLAALETILKLQLKTSTQILECQFSTSGIVSLDSTLNWIKGDTLFCFSELLKLRPQFLSDMSSSSTEFRLFAQKVMLPREIQSILKFCEHPETSFEDFYDDSEKRDINIQGLQKHLLESICFLSHVGLGFSEDSVGEYQRLILNVCLPLIMSTQKEKEQFVKNPEIYFAIEGDACQEQEIRICKTKAVQLLESLVDDIDDAAYFIVRLLLAVIEYSITEATPDSIPEKYPTLDNYKETVFLAKTDPLTRIETSLLILSALGYRIYERKDDLVLIENLLTKYQDKFFGPDIHPILKSRMCVFVESYFDCIFQKETEKHLAQLQITFLIDCISLKEEKDQAIVAQAACVLLITLTQPEIASRLQPFIFSMIERLACCIEFVKRIDYFDAIQALFRDFSKRLIENPKDFLLLVEKMINRTMLECEDLVVRKESDSNILDRIWEILLMIANNPKYIHQYQTDIEKLMEPLEPHLEKKRFYFGGAMIQYVGVATKVSNNVSPFCWSIFKFFPFFSADSGNILGNMLEALNQLIMKGKDKFQEGEASHLKTIIGMGILGLNPTVGDADDVDICKAALLLQLIFQSFGKIIIKNDFETMIQACLEKLKTDQPGFVKVKIMKVLLCAFLVNYELTSQIIHKNKAMREVLEVCLGQSLNFEHRYDRKILMLGLCQLVSSGFEDPLIVENIFRIFDVLISFLRAAELIDRVKNTKEGPSLIPIQVILNGFLSDKSLEEIIKKLHQDDEDDEDDDEEEEKVEEEEKNDEKSSEGSNSKPELKERVYMKIEKPLQKEMRTIMDELDSEIFEKNEFSVFKETVKSVSDEIMAQILDRLSLNRKEYLGQVFQSQRVVLTNDEGKTEMVARRVVKVTRRKGVDNEERKDLEN